MRFCRSVEYSYFLSSFFFLFLNFNSQFFKPIICFLHLFHCLTSLVAQTVKRLPTMQKTQVQSLGWENLLEKEIATHSSVLAWRIPGMGEPGGLTLLGLHRVGRD